jgi:hypothetical protein
MNERDASASLIVLFFLYKDIYNYNGQVKENTCLEYVSVRKDGKGCDDHADDE